MIRGLFNNVMGVGGYSVRAPTVNTKAGSRAIGMQQTLGSDRLKSGMYSLAAGARGGDMALARREAQRRSALGSQELAGQGMAQTAQLEQAAAQQNAQMQLQAGMANMQAKAQEDAAFMGMIGSMGGAAMMASDEHSKKRIVDLETENARLKKSVPAAVVTGAASVANPFMVLPAAGAVAARKYLDSRRAPAPQPVGRPLFQVHEGPDTGPDEAAALAVVREREALNRQEQERDIAGQSAMLSKVNEERRKLAEEPGSGGRMAQVGRMMGSDEKIKKGLVDLDKQKDTEIAGYRGKGDAKVSAGLDAIDRDTDKSNAKLRSMTGAPQPAGYSIFDGPSARPAAATSPYPRAINPTTYSVFDDAGAGPRPRGARAQVRGGMPMDFSGQRAGAGFGGDYGFTKQDVVDTMRQQTIAGEARNRALAADAHRQGPSARQVLGISDADAAVAAEQERRGLPTERGKPYDPGAPDDFRDQWMPHTTYDPEQSDQRWRALLADAGYVPSDERTKGNIHGAELGFDRVKPISFEYEKPYARIFGEGRHYGVSAQNLEKAGPATRSLVEESPAGTKMVDTDRATMLLLAQAASAEKRLRKLEGGKRRKVG